MILIYRSTEMHRSQRPLLSTVAVLSCLVVVAVSEASDVALLLPTELKGRDDVVQALRGMTGSRETEVFWGSLRDAKLPEDVRLVFEIASLRRGSKPIQVSEESWVEDPAKDIEVPANVAGIPAGTKIKADKRFETGFTRTLHTVDSAFALHVIRDSALQPFEITSAKAKAHGEQVDYYREGPGPNAFSGRYRYIGEVKAKQDAESVCLRQVAKAMGQAVSTSIIDEDTTETAVAIEGEDGKPKYIGPPFGSFQVKVKRAGKTRFTATIRLQNVFPFRAIGKVAFAECGGTIHRTESRTYYVHPVEEIGVRDAEFSLAPGESTELTFEIMRKSPGTNGALAAQFITECQQNSYAWLSSCRFDYADQGSAINQTPKNPRPAARPDKPKKEATPEEDAERLLGLASLYLQNKNEKSATIVLTDLVDKYPDTAAAKRARELLNSLGDNPPKE